MRRFGSEIRVRYRPPVLPGSLLAAPVAVPSPSTGHVPHGEIRGYPLGVQDAGDDRWVGELAKAPGEAGRPSSRDPHDKCAAAEGLTGTQTLSPSERSIPTNTFRKKAWAVTK